VPNAPSDPILPVRHVKRSFENLLKATGLLHDPDGQKRTPYRLRHYYVTKKLMQGVSVSKAARNTMTSAAMIGRYYDHLTTLMAIEELAAEE
jgi:integrase